MVFFLRFYREKYKQAEYFFKSLYIIIEDELKIFYRGVIGMKKINVKTAGKKPSKKNTDKYIVCVGKNF